MSKVLVDRELLERAVSIPTKESQEANSEAIIDRGRAQADIRKLLAQPAEAEGVELQRLTAEFDAAPDDAEWEPPHPIFQMARDLDRVTAALSAVTAERDSLLQFKAAHLEWHEKTEWVQETAQVHELGKHRADVLKDRIDQLRAEADRLRNELAGKPLVC